MVDFYKSDAGAQAAWKGFSSQTLYISSQNVMVVLLDYFSNQQYDIEDVQRLSQIRFLDWIGYANAIRSMFWLDAKRYVERNMTFISSLVAKRGKGWLCFLPLDLSGIERSDELIADGIKDMSIFNKVDLQNAIDEVKNSLTSLSINYEATDCFINNSEIPSFLPNTDTERSSFGYADEQNSELLNVVQLFFDCYEEIETVIINKNDPSELIQIIETVSVMLIIAVIIGVVPLM